ncbi:MAG: ATP-binding protein [Chloroflexi bacterium]|nr:ATP-binding protein [Chloroflexota bacterium]
MRITPHHVVDESRQPPDRTGVDDLLYGARVAVWVRHFVLLAWFAQMNYRANFADPNYVPNSLFAAATLALNGYVHYRILTGRTVTWRWMLALSVMDVTMLTAGIAVSSSFQNSFFVLYYPALAMFAVVFTSSRLSFLAVTLVAAAYATVSVLMEPVVDLEAKEEKILFTRIVVMYGIVVAVNLISRFERIRRREAVERERELQRERVELSQTIHDTIAQSTYMIGIGIETAVELADDREGENRDEILAKLYATHALSKSTMWELRHPIDAGPLFEGRELSRVLRSHASTFATITSIPAEMVQSGREPPLPALTRRLLFSIAHNAMTNALRHAEASRVTVSLDFGDDGLRMSISDDGVGLSEGYTERGHGFRNMQADAERMGGHLEVSLGGPGRGTTVTCVVPYGPHGGGM